jgi:hypothetical protein
MQLAIGQLTSLVTSLATKLDDSSERFDTLEAKLKSDGDGADRYADSDPGARSDDRRSRYESSDDSSSGTDSLASSTEHAPAQEYLQVPSNLGFCKASERAALVDQAPSRFSLHGYEPFDKLVSGRRGDGGTLGMCMQYLEPSRLYFKVGTRGLKEVVRRMSPEDDSYLDIRACLNTLEGAYLLPLISMK